MKRLKSLQHNNSIKNKTNEIKISQLSRKKIETHENKSKESRNLTFTKDRICSIHENLRS